MIKSRHRIYHPFAVLPVSSVAYMLNSRFHVIQNQEQLIMPRIGGAMGVCGTGKHIAPALISHYSINRPSAPGSKPGKLSIAILPACMRHSKG